MITESLATVTRPDDDAIAGIGRALSHFEHSLMNIPDRDLVATNDMLVSLRAAQSWLMTISIEIHRDDVANDR